MKRLFISSVQKEFEHERAAIKRMIESDPILKPYFTVFVFEIDAPASDKSTQQVYLGEIEKSDIYLVLIGNRYGYCHEEVSGRFRIVIWRPAPATNRGDNGGAIGGTIPLWVFPMNSVAFVRY